MKTGKQWIVKTPEGERWEALSLEALCREHAAELAEYDRGGSLSVEIRAARQLAKSGLWRGFQVQQKGSAGRNGNGPSPALERLRECAPLLNLSELARRSGLNVDTLKAKANGRRDGLSHEDLLALRAALKPVERFIDRRPRSK